MRPIAGVVVLCGLVVPLVAGPAADPTPDEVLAAFEKKIKDISETAGPAVVYVVVARSDKYPKPTSQEYPGQLGGFDPQEFRRADPTPTRAALAHKLDLSNRENIPDHGTANGVVIDPSGLVLTTNGAIDGATKLYVHFASGKGSYADIHAADARSDLAVLRLLTPPPDLRAVTIGEARPADVQNGPRKSVYPGKLIVALALTYSPNSELRQPSAWAGSVAGIPRRLKASRSGGRELTWYKYGFVLEFQTLLNRQIRGGVAASLAGNGIPLFNLDAEVIALTTTHDAAVDADPGPGSALPIDTNGKRIVEVLRRGEEVEYGFLGVSIPNEATALTLLSVSEHSPAALAGLRTGDTITHINGVPGTQYEDLLLHAGTSLAGTKIHLRVQNGTDRKYREVDVTLAKFKNEVPYIASKRPEPVFGLRVDYGSVVAQPARGVFAGNGSVPQGVAVREVVADSPAASKFKTLGDTPTRFVITAVNGTRTTTPADFYKAARGQASVKLTLLDLYDQNPQERELTIP
jgi:serine protease Do